MLSIDSMVSPTSPDRDGVLTRPASPPCISEVPAQTDCQLSPDTAQNLVDSTPATVRSQCLPWLASLVYPLARYGLLPLYFRRIEVFGRENLPTSGPVILAPTHRSRWDAFMVPYAAGQDITGRTLRFMVTADEVKGIQGWFIRRLGGFPINTRHPAIAALRHSVDLMQRREVLVIFPEGNVFRQCRPLKPGLARLALQAEASQPNLGIQIVPIAIQYSQPLVPWRSAVKIRIGKPLNVSDYCLETPKLSAQQLTIDLENVLRSLSGAACQKVN